ncbi:MAG: efflux RND transporter periplasmic adaptor subunit [Deltaproteobacteria bacterium]|jgi:RND family efflux transporter MFP subunit|nr:efflux RND transporter periplasmic adaptor subunit [Deltaproteobacteria bacterium]MBW2498201.1 efflux RND transporter periplasmic adaptor subunit [Deltaproteobacteria bacterium]
MSDPLPFKPRHLRDADEASAETLGEGAPPEVGSRRLRWILPLVVLLFAFSLAWALVASREDPEQVEPVVRSPLVRVITVEPEDVRLKVIARGSVAPRTESDLVAEVRGRVLSVSAHLVVGGFFSSGDELLRLDDREHRIARDRARSTVALRQSEARLASADARRRRELARSGVASTADLEQYESRALVALAALSEARASLEQAELDLQRTVVRAPFDGRVRERNVDVGQFVSPGQKLGRIFAVDYAEVRLPIQTDDLAHLEIDLQGASTGEDLGGTQVLLTGRLGGREWTWPARLMRTEAAIDEQTRMLHVVARVDNPYGVVLAEGQVLELPEGGPDAEEFTAGMVPLPAGLFVTAEISGRELEDVIVLPPMALRDDDRIFLVDDEGRLRIRKVSVVRKERSRVIVDAGLVSGDRVVISPMRVHSEGMALRVVEASES